MSKKRERPPENFHLTETETPITYEHARRPGVKIIENPADGRWFLETDLEERSRHWSPLDAAWHFASLIASAANAPKKSANPASGIARIMEGR